MIIKGLRLSQAEEYLYHELIRLGYPEDRIQSGYRVNEQYRSDFTIMAPGLVDIPIAVFEVSNYNEQKNKRNIKDFAKITEKILGCTFYLYAEMEQTFQAFKVINNELQKVQLPSYSDLLLEWRKYSVLFERISVENFTIFKKASFSFGKKINLIIGGNGSGKTQFLKLLYSISSSLMQYEKIPQRRMDFALMDVTDIFNILDGKELINRVALVNNEAMTVDVKLSNIKGFAYTVDNDDGLSFCGGLPNRISLPSVVFMPARELLSIFPSFLPFSRTYKEKWPYDQTYVDTISYLGLRPISSQNSDVEAICKKIEKSIDGYFYLDEKKDKFMMKKNSEDKPYEIDMTAEGWRKLGELFLLLKNGAITQGSILLWDEPEANLNPALIRLLASIILELGNLGIQVFLTTHSLFLMKEIDMLIKSDRKFGEGDVRYFNFLKPGKVEEGNTPEDLSDILLLDESLAQSDRYMQMEE